jgi:hypothetical protein
MAMVNTIMHIIIHTLTHFCFKLNLNGAVTLRKPPNNKLFDLSSKSRLSPVLQRRKEQQDATAAAARPPIFNISLGNDFANILRPPPVANQLPLPPAYPQPHSFLLPASRLPGLDMSLADFCQIYQLGDPILQKFVKNGFVQSRMLRFVQIAELKEMEFLLGEIAALKDAVETWSIAA